MPDDLDRTVRDWFAAWNARDFDALRALYCPDAAYLRPDGFSQGADAITAYLKGVAAASPGETGTVDAVLGDNDAVAVEWTARGGPDGRARMAEFFRFQDGKILSQHQFGDPVRTIRLLTRTPVHAAVQGAQSAWSQPASPAETLVGAMPTPMAVVAPVQDERPPEARSVPLFSLDLAVTSGPDQELTFTIADQELKLGRAPDNDIVLRDPCTSGHHARLERQGDVVVVFDLGSTNGTHVNGVQVQRCELHEGDQLVIGDNVLTVRSAWPSTSELSLQSVSA